MSLLLRSILLLCFTAILYAQSESDTTPDVTTEDPTHQSTTTQSAIQTSTTQEKTSHMTSSSVETSTSYEKSTTPETLHTTTKIYPTPTTIAPKDKSTYYVKSNKGTVCLIVKSTIYLMVSYSTKNNKKTKKVSIPLNRNVYGTCKSTENVMNVKWTPIGSNAEMELTMNFRKVDKKSYFDKITFKYFANETFFPNIAKKNVWVTVDKNVSGEYTVGADGSYFCPNVTIKMTDKSNSEDALAVLESFNFDAFRTSNSTVVRNKKASCPPLTTDQIIGITFFCFYFVLVILFSLLAIIKAVRNKRKTDYETLSDLSPVNA